MEKGKTYLRLLRQAFHDFDGNADVEEQLARIWDCWSRDDVGGARRAWMALPKDIRGQVPPPPDHESGVQRRIVIPEGDDVPHPFARR